MDRAERLPRRMLVLFDVLLGVLVAIHVASLLLASDVEPWFLAAGVTGAAGLAVCWSLWRITHRRHWLIGLLAGGILVLITPTGGTGVLFLVLITSLAAWAFGLKLACGWLVVVAAAIALQMRLAWQQDWVNIAVESIVTLLIGGVGLLVGQLMLDLSKERRANQRLLEELKATHHVETELMLAEERARSARELHDGLGHRLTLIGLSLEFAVSMRERDPKAAHAEVGNAREQAGDALTYMRRWVRALNPPRETSLTGIAGFEAIADSFRGTGLDITVEPSGVERPLGKQASLFAYRLVQEGLTNVLRHSTADKVELRVDWGESDVTVTVADNGVARGGEIEHDTAAGFGLRSLTERAEQLGGSFSAGFDERGMVLTGRVPADDAHDTDQLAHSRETS